MHETAYLNPELTIIFEDLRGETKEHIVYHEPEGILGFIRDLNSKKETSMSRCILKERRRAYRWKWSSSMSTSFMKCAGVLQQHL